MSSDHTESIFEPIEEIVDYDDVDEEADTHPRHSHNSEDTGTALLTDQLESDYSNGKQPNSDQK